MEKQNTRYYLVDAVRGAAILNMVVFHFLYDVFMICGKNPAWYGRPEIQLWQQLICQTFILLSGFVWQWGLQGNVRRAVLFHLYGLAISVVTLAVIPSQTIWFGILNFMGSAILLMYPLQKVLDRLPPACGLAASLMLFVCFRQIQHGFLGIGGLVQFRVPKLLYSVKILTPLGFPFPGFYSSDYFPVLPWIFLYLCGYFASRIFCRHSAWLQAARIKIPLLSAIGGRTIWIYLLHQPVCMLVCMLAQAFTPFPGDHNL